MDDLALSLVGYLLTQQPPVSLLTSMRKDLRGEEPLAEKLIDYLIETVPCSMSLPDYCTLQTLLGPNKEYDELLAASQSIERAAGDLNGYALLYYKRNADKKIESLSTQLRKAIEAGDREKILSYAEQLTAAGNSGMALIGPVPEESFYDLDDIMKEETLLSTHIPRLNQHLGGSPNGIDFEESGGFSLGELDIIGGSTNHGKSTLAQSLWEHFISKSLEDKSYKSVYFNYEGAYTRFRKTLFAMVTGVYPYKPGRYLDPANAEYKRFMEPRRGNFLLYDGAGGDMPVSSNSLEVEICKKAEEGFKAFFIDTINSIDNRDGKASWEITEDAMRMLERVAKRYELCIIATAQNKQGLQFEEDKWPEIKWLGQSAALQQKAGVGIGIYRADLFSGGTIDYTTIAIMKLRHRGFVPREGVNVSYDRNRRMYVPYVGAQTGVVEASENVQEGQILSALSGEIETAYADV
jgi:replicative DNA helicase